MLKLLYGCGLRVNELLRLRIKDIDFGFDKVYAWNGKSQQDGALPLPQKIKEDLEIHIENVRKTHKQDLVEHAFLYLRQWCGIAAHCAKSRLKQLT